jgi:hypothetical protein
MDDVKNQQPEQPHVVGYMPDSPDGEPLITLESHEEFVSKLMQPGLEAWQKGRDGMREERDAQRLRADTAEAENRILRHSNASFLETVGKVCDLLGIDLDDAKHADGQPSDVLFNHAKAQAEKLAAAEQRIAELKAVLERMLEDDDMPVHWFAQRIDAALNPNPEAGSHEVAREALKMENQRITPARFKCLACGDCHEGSGNLPCPKMTPYAEGQSQRTIDALKDAGFLGSKP